MYIEYNHVQDDCTCIPCLFSMLVVVAKTFYCSIINILATSYVIYDSYDHSSWSSLIYYIILILMLLQTLERITLFEAY